MWNSVIINKDCIPEYPYHFCTGRHFFSCWCIGPLLFHRLFFFLKLEGTLKVMSSVPVHTENLNVQAMPDLSGVS